MLGGPSRPQPARLKKRSEFLAVQRGLRLPRRGFLLEVLKPAGRDDAPARFGFTVTKKVGNAVERNRIRRRLREAVRLVGGSQAKPGADHVLVGRRQALTLPFKDICTDLLSALAAAETTRPDGRSPGKRPSHVR